MLVTTAQNHKIFAKMATEKTQIRLLLQKQSNQGLYYLSRPFWQELEFEI